MKKKLRLSPFLRVGIQSGKLYFGFGSVQKEISLPSLQKKYLEISSHFSTPQDQAALNSTVLDQDIIDDLTKRKILIPEDGYDPANRYSRHHLYYLMSGADSKDVQARLKNSHVVVLGCGGIGNLLATSLAASGVGKITLVDNDEIELTNLTRQFLFTEADIGKYKVDVLKENILARNSECEIQSIKKHIKNVKDLHDLPKSDLMIASADVDNVCEHINQYSSETKTPWINIGYVEDVAVWGPFVIPGKTGCLACQDNNASEQDENNNIRDMIRTINRNYQAPSTGPINMLSISLAMFDILRYLGGFGTIQSLNTRIGLWTHELTFEKQSYHKNKDCKVCSSI